MHKIQQTPEFLNIHSVTLKLISKWATILVAVYLAVDLYFDKAKSDDNLFVSARVI
jgi:hypothetical protein